MGLFGQNKDTGPKRNDETENTAGAADGAEESKSIDSAPPLKPFAKGGSHNGASKPAAPSLPARHPSPDIPRRVTEIPGAPRRSDRTRQAEENGKTLTVGRDICLNGQISACETLVVEGRVEAELNEANLINVTQTGTFVGKSDVKNADISGFYDGDLTVRNKLTLRPGGQIKGTVRYGTLVIEAGGEINGTLESLSPSDDAAEDS